MIDLALGTLPRRKVLSHISQAIQGMEAVQTLMDTGALRMSDDHTATIRAFLGALDEQWRLLLDPQDVTLAALRWELGLAAAPPAEKSS